MRPHAFYERYLGGELVRFLRVRCASCRITHAVLPSDVCAYRDLLVPAWEAALATGRGPTAGARADRELMRVALEALQAEVDRLKARLDQNSSNSHGPPSTDPPGVPKPPKKKPTGRKKGGQ